MQKLSMPATVKVNPEGTPTSVEWPNGMQAVNRVLDRWQLDLDWAPNDAGREYFEVELSNRTRLRLSLNRNSGTWEVNAVKEPWFRRLLPRD